MIVYHGTTRGRAARICREGFVPKKPSRRVWFAESRAYAERRGKTQARRSRDRPVVLVCDIDINQIRKVLGARRVFNRNGVIAVDGRVPVTVLRSHPGLALADSARELADWLNRILGVKPYRGIGWRHPGVQRLSRWVSNRMAGQNQPKVHASELLHLARQWLPEFFAGVVLDPKRLEVHRRAETIEVEVVIPEADARVFEAIELLDDSKPKRRVRGLSMLVELDDPDLSEWCALCLDDESVSVRIAALRAMGRCGEADVEFVKPFANAENRRIRAAALAVLAKHSGNESARWFKRALKDPSPCVRVESARLLTQLDPIENREIFELALYDPNPEIARLAEKLTAGKGFQKIVLRSTQFERRKRSRAAMGQRPSLHPADLPGK